MKLLYIFLLLFGCNAIAHREGIQLHKEQIHDPKTLQLNIDLPTFDQVEVPRGTYRILTGRGLTPYYVKFVLDGKIARVGTSSTCFYTANFDGKYDQVFCLDPEKISLR